MSKPKRQRPKRPSFYKLRTAEKVVFRDMRLPSKKNMRDIQIAQKRLDELRRSPEKVVRGAALAKKMKRWTS